MKTVIKLGVSLLALIISMSQVVACTGTKIVAKDGSNIFARTLEFGADTESDIIVIPRNYSLQASALEDTPALSWKSQYAVIGTNAKNFPVIVEGFNEKGLRVGTFYFPGFAGYQDVSKEQAKNSIGSVDVGAWLLTNFSTIDEVKKGIQSVMVSKAKFKPWDVSLPLHYIVSEPNGQSVVIEYVDGKVSFYDASLGVITNSPGYQWHMTNLRNYVNLSPQDVNEVQLNQLKLKDLGLGSGMHGIPGDFTPPSRFVRSAIFTQTLVPVDNAEKAVLQVFHLLNNFDIPKGAVREKIQGQIFNDFTQWTSASDLKNKRFYIHTYDNRAIKMVDLTKFNLDAKTIKVIPLKSMTKINDVTTSAIDYNAP
jgi:choloylglycine hydrolase